MKKTLLLVFTLFLCSNLYSQSSPILMFNSGMSIPTSPELFSDYWQTGYNLGGGLGFRATNKLTIQLYADYNSMTLNDSEFLKMFELQNSGISISGGDAHVLYISANLKFNMADSSQKISPYIICGLGFFHFSFSNLTTIFEGQSVQGEVPSDQSVAGINLGLGLEFSLSNAIKMFIDGRYLIGFTEGEEKTSYFPFRIGLAFSL